MRIFSALRTENEILGCPVCKSENLDVEWYITGTQMCYQRQSEKHLETWDDKDVSPEYPIRISCRDCKKHYELDDINEVWLDSEEEWEENEDYES